MLRFPLMTLGIVCFLGFCLLAGWALWLMLELRRQGREYSERLDAVIGAMEADGKRINLVLAGIQMGMGEFERRFGHHGQELVELNKKSEAAFDARRDFDHILQNFDVRLDSAEAKIDIPKQRPRIRAPFSTLRGLAEAGARKTEDSILKHSEPTNAA